MKKKLRAFFKNFVPLKISLFLRKLFAFPTNLALSLKTMAVLKSLCFLEKLRVRERLGQGHLHPKLEVPRMTCPGCDSNLGLCGGRREEPFKQLI
jgi:hypothetical protein